ncbi:IS21 family transposase [Methylophilus sp. YYY-1]|uniref:IS21 family transposase n=1 Tax=Methylophilus sp. YYY-1 TaxID=2682087 RepID=UPI0023B24F36|nr:IS21 family transposase [Methylophilus sp. YYY-1]MDF0379022.1 IS21 family transposase [Methylophilus sp. YYY-1]
MKKIRHVLRLHYEHKYSQRKISEYVGISRDSVCDYITRAVLANITWPLPENMDDASLEQQLFPHIDKKILKFPEPDCTVIHQEMKQKGATLKVLHDEYLAANNGIGMGYSSYCDRYRIFKEALSPVMRQIHIAGEKVFVDYAGPTMNIVDPQTGYIQTAQIFVGVMGASNYTYAEAHWSQQLPNWIAAHTRMFEFFGAVPTMVICDNLKSGVKVASRTDPVLNSVYQNLGDHYGVIVFPTRAREPKDKAKVENGVLIVERWIMFRLRKRIFTSLKALNNAISELLVDLNERPFKKIPGSRQACFESIDLPAMQPLPSVPFVYAEFRKVRIGLDYHFSYEGHFYSVPHAFVRKEVELRITANTIEVLHGGRRIASHSRDPNRITSTNPEHMTASHREIGHWQADDLLLWAEQAGEYIYNFTKQLIASTQIQIQGYRASLSLKKLAKEFGEDRLNLACQRLLAIASNQINTSSTTRLRSILSNRLDQQPLSNNELIEAKFDHSNIRGSDYYH